MAQPIGDVHGFREPTIDDLREEYLARAHAKNLAPRTIEWYERHSATFLDWCLARRITSVADLRATHLDEFLIAVHASGAAPNTVHGAGQVAKSMARLAFRKGYLEQEISRDFVLPKVPQMVIATFSDEQLRALFGVVDQRRWIGIRDRAILLLLLDTLARISELLGLALEDLDLGERAILVMGKGRRQRELPFGHVAADALGRYLRTVQDHRPSDPLFISRTGRRLSREGIAAAMRAYAGRAGIQGVRSSPHTLRHTGARRFILSGGDVFTLQRLLGHRSLAMVRRYVELAAADVRLQHERHSPADTLLRRPRITPRRSRF